MNNPVANQQIIKEGLTQFIGAYLSHSPLKPYQSRHDVAAMLMQEVVNLSLDKNNSMDPYVLKPVFRVMYNYYHNCHKEIQEAIEAEKQANGNKELIRVLSEKDNVCINLLHCFKDVIDTVEPIEEGI